MPSYTFYFEINSNNVKDICSSLPHRKEWTGFDWTNANYITIGSCTKNDKNTTFPIKAYLNAYSDPLKIEQTDYTITRNDLDIRDPNSFFLWDDVKGSSSYSFECQCDLPLIMNSGDATSFTSSCSGTDCQTWLPPINGPYPKQLHQLTTNAVPHQIGCFSGTFSNSGGSVPFSGIINKGTVSFSFPLYKPVSYTSVPTVNVNNEYVPNPSVKGAFYNCGPFQGILQLTSTNLDESGTVNGVCSCKTVPKPASNSYAIYQVRYNISSSTITKKTYYNNMNDFLYLQQYLYSNSTQSFLNSEYWTTTLDNIKEMIIDYCNATANMTNDLCSSTFSNFIFLQSGSPCIKPYSTCTKGWGDYCFNENNYSSSECLNYYTNSYISSSNVNDPNLLLDDNVVQGLQKTCQNIYVQTDDPVNDLSQDYWNICACFLPNQYYQNYLEQNNYQDLSIGATQCWYLPCSNASIVPESNPICPNNSISNCIQDAYVTVKTNNPANIQNDVIQTQQTITTCGSKTVEPIGEAPVNNTSDELDIFSTTFPPDGSTIQQSQPQQSLSQQSQPQQSLTQQSLAQENNLQSKKNEKVNSSTEIEKTTAEVSTSWIGIFIIVVIVVVLIVAICVGVYKSELEKKKKR